MHSRSASLQRMEVWLEGKEEGKRERERGEDLTHTTDSCASRMGYKARAEGSNKKSTQEGDVPCCGYCTVNGRRGSALKTEMLAEVAKPSAPANETI